MREKILEMLKNSEDYVSGEEMSGRLGITRAAVWKHIKALRSEGYEIESVRNRGYRLKCVSDELSPERISEMLDTKYMGRKLVCSDTVDSTNEEAKRNSDMPEGTLFIAERQTLGKGRRGRAWESPRGSGIWMSVLLKPDIPVETVSEITLAAGLAVARAAGGALIKWPNDVVIGTKKLSGILTEMAAETDRIEYVICGIGINVNNETFPSELSEKATSLFIETGERHDRSALAARVMNEFEPLYERLAAGGFSAIRQEYEKLCVTLGRQVVVSRPGREFSGKAIGMRDNGALVVETEDGTADVASGEVSVRGMYGYV